MKSSTFFHRKFPAAVASLILFLGISFSGFAQGKIKVACIGNSITQGHGLTKEQAYPAQLQLLLGDGYEVHNYGKSGRTLLLQGDRPYRKESVYSDALAWNPDIVIIKLGTNDTKPQNWKYKKDFVADYVRLVRSFQQLPSHPKVYVCYPIPVFQTNWGINDSTMRRGILPKVKKVRRKTRTRLIDLYHPFLGKDTIVMDGVHPTAEGARMLAGEVYKSLSR
ncbi:GDSL-type esterase/lipase family protein [Paraflavisolibacter sp. H34]|uniref:GDSL-type esterase/lipase family protein n=1 Tax=Huijunlia imazamoxiresistens TaxID=3127457 RepID=UPI003019447D